MKEPSGPRWWLRLRGWRRVWRGDVEVRSRIDWDAPIESLAPMEVRVLAVGYRHVAWRVSFRFAAYGIMSFPVELWVKR